MAKTEEFGALSSQVQNDAVRAALLRVIEEEEIAEAVLRAIAPKLAAIHHRIDEVEKQLASRGPSVPTRPAPAVEDPTYALLDWTQGIVRADPGPSLRPSDLAIPESTQETWHTNPME